MSYVRIGSADLARAARDTVRYPYPPNDCIVGPTSPFAGGVSLFIFGVALRQQPQLRRMSIAPSLTVRRLLVDSSAIQRAAIA